MREAWRELEIILVSQKVSNFLIEVGLGLCVCELVKKGQQKYSSWAAGARLPHLSY